MGATARFAEISEDLTVDPGSQALVTGLDPVLLPVHLYGLPADMERVNAIARRHGLVVIQDAAQAHAAQLGPEPIGRFSTATFSFYATKNITCGEGGMITTNDDGVVERLRLLRNHGMRKRYDYALPGYNYRLTDLQAAIANVQLSRLPELTLRRAHNAARLSAGLAGLSGLILPVVPGGRRHVWHQYTVQVPRPPGWAGTNWRNFWTPPIRLPTTSPSARLPVLQRSSAGSGRWNPARRACGRGSPVPAGTSGTPG